MHRSSKKVGLAYRMRVLTQWHNSYTTCSGFRSRRANVLYLKTKELRGMLFHVVTHCKKGEERGRRCVCICVCVCLCVCEGGDTYSPCFLDSQLPKVERSSQYFWPISLMLIICMTEGCLKYCLLLVCI